MCLLLTLMDQVVVSNSNKKISNLTFKQCRFFNNYSKCIAKIVKPKNF